MVECKRAAPSADDNTKPVQHAHENKNQIRYALCEMSNGDDSCYGIIIGNLIRFFEYYGPLNQFNNHPDFRNFFIFNDRMVPLNTPPPPSPYLFFLNPYRAPKGPRKKKRPKL
uniref:Uncharacterized protein n=1 Tax=Morchella brunnea TaxID=1174671 RepID=A0A8K1MH88_9PEZI|nr:hypothetical protein LK370_mgp004 [Morchella brunnea]UBU98416.1 hypothetical protein [Morchella brunnea]